jgi:hypothetical protein
MGWSISLWPARTGARKWHMHWLALWSAQFSSVYSFCLKGGRIGPWKASRWPRGWSRSLSEGRIHFSLCASASCSRISARASSRLRPAAAITASIISSRAVSRSITTIWISVRSLMCSAVAWAYSRHRASHAGQLPCGMGFTHQRMPHVV